MDSLDQLTDFESLLEQVRHVKNDTNASIADKAEYFYKTLVEWSGSCSEIEEKLLSKCIKLSREKQELQASYDKLSDSLSEERREVESKDAELLVVKAALRDAQKDCEAKEKYIAEAETANAALKEKNDDQRNQIRTCKQKWKPMKEELELRDREIDDLQSSLRNKDALVDKYEREIEQYRKQRKEWEEAAQLKWLNRVSRPLKDNPKASSSEASSSGRPKLSESIVGPTTDDEEDNETHSTTDFEKDGKLTSATGSSTDRRLDLQEMDCSSDRISVDEAKPICGTTLDEEMMYLSDSLSALSIEERASPTKRNMSHRREIPSPASSYDLGILPGRRKRRNQRTKEVDDSELARKRTKVRKHCESPIQTDSGESTSFDVQDHKQESPEGCSSPVQTDSEANPSLDSGGSDKEQPETRRPVCRETVETNSTSRGVQTVADQMDGPVTIPSIEVPVASGRSQPLLSNGRRGWYQNPVYLRKPYAKSQRLTHQRREPDVRRPRHISVTRPVLRKNFGQETPSVSPSLSHGSESLEAEADDGPVRQTASRKHQPRSGYKSQSDSKVPGTVREQGIFASSTPTITGGKVWLRLVTVLLLSLFIIPKLCPDGERRSWDRANMMPHEPLTKLHNCPDSRLNVARAAEWEFVRRTDSDFLPFE